MARGKLESEFQTKVLRPRLEELFPGCIVTKMDPNEIQGIPDLLVLYHDRWALLEVKRSSKAVHQPNQDHYVAKFRDWSYSAFVYPENMEEVLDELQSAFRTR